MLAVRAAQAVHAPAPAVPAPPRASRVFEDFCNHIRAQLARGQLKLGDKLPSERDLAEAHGISRAAVREALRNLERGGVIELRRGIKGGTYVRQASPSLVTQSLNDMLSVGGVSIASLTESRAIVQDAVVRLACERGTESDFDRLDESIRLTARLTREGRTEERRVQLLEFYRLLGCATHNEVMVMLVQALTDIVLQLLASHDAPPRASSPQAHRQIVQALRDRDADRAAGLMADHLQKLHSYFARVVRAADKPQSDAGNLHPHVQHQTRRAASHQA